LVRYRCLLGPGVDLLNAFLDGLLRRDVRHGLAMFVSPLVPFFHPLHLFRVGLVEGLQTDSCALSGAQSLVDTKGIEQAAHELRKTEALTVALLCVSVILPSLTRHDRNLFLRRRAPDKQAQFLIKFVVYYESRKRELKIRLMNEGRCDERLKVRVEESTRLTYTGLHKKKNRHTKPNPSPGLAKSK
jgi:hypothetical protein